MCGGCGRKPSRDEQAALEDRFAAANADYRMARATVGRALTVVLVSGLLSMALAVIRIALERAYSEPAPLDTDTVAPFLDGAILVALFVVGRRAPMLAVVAASVLWLIGLIVPFVIDPATAALSIASAGGVVLGIARIGVLLMLVQALPSVWSMKRLRNASATNKA